MKFKSNNQYLNYSKKKGGEVMVLDGHHERNVPGKKEKKSFMITKTKLNLGSDHEWVHEKRTQHYFRTHLNQFPIHFALHQEEEIESLKQKSRNSKKSKT